LYLIEQVLSEVGVWDGDCVLQGGVVAGGWLLARSVWARSPCGPSRNLLQPTRKDIYHDDRSSHVVDPATVLEEALGQAWPDLMRSLLQTMINALVSADADAALGRRVRPSQFRARCPA